MVSSVALARRLERAGVDGFIVEGMECEACWGANHYGFSSQIVDATSLPVIAAGGILMAEVLWLL